MHRLLAIIFSGLAIGLAGCASSPGGTGIGEAVSVASFPETDSAQPDATSPAYRLSVGDLIDISVFQVPDLTRSVQVDAAGQISLPLIGVVKAGGRTPHELEGDIAAKLGARYVRSPQVSVFLKESAGQRVTVDGAVRNPGVFPIVGQMSLVQALAEAKGLDDVDDPEGVLVFRSVSGKRLVAKFDLSAIRAGKAADPPLAGGDTIVVDQSGLKSTWKQFRESLPVGALFTPLL